MVTAFLFFISSSIFGYFVGRDIDRVIQSTMAFGLLGTMVGLVFAMFSGLFLTSPDDFEKAVETNKLVSLSNNMETEGNFFLGIGSVSGSKKYYYYVDTPKGIHGRSVYANDAYIMETDTTEPKISKHEFELTDEAVYWSFYFPVGFSPDDYEKIIIPKGSIERQYNPN